MSPINLQISGSFWQSKVVTLKLQGACWFLMKKNINNKIKCLNEKYFWYKNLSIYSCSIICHQNYQLLNIPIFDQENVHFNEKRIKNTYKDCVFRRELVRNRIINWMFCFNLQRSKYGIFAKLYKSNNILSYTDSHTYIHIYSLF